MVFAPPHDTVLICDGGLATELEARGHDLSDDLWSAGCWSTHRRRLWPYTAAFSAAGAALPPPRATGAVRRIRCNAESGETTPPADDAAASSWPRPPATRCGWRQRGWPRPSGRTALHWPTARSASAATDSQSSSWPTGTGRGSEMLVDAVIRRAGDRDRARYRRVRGACRAGARARRPGVAVLHDRRDDHPRRSASGRCVRRRRRCAGSRCGGRQLLCTRRRRARARRSPRSHRKARHRLSQ